MGLRRAARRLIAQALAKSKDTAPSQLMGMKLNLSEGERYHTSPCCDLVMRQRPVLLNGCYHNGPPFKIVNRVTMIENEPAPRPSLSVCQPESDGDPGRASRVTT